MEKKEILPYLNNFKREFNSYLKNDYSLKTVIYRSNEGVIMEILLRKDLEERDEFKKEEDSISIQLSKLDQNTFNNNPHNYKFKGTNIILEPNKIIIIKDSNLSEWTEKKAIEDVSKILNTQK
jgi:CRISPR/Cas system CMR-associated protein Cmr1 (group 7 of RAMP superfamily)